MSDTTARGFLHDICANPDDDTPRLIYADWLEDRGEVDRAEFIRAQIERANLPDWDVRHVRLLIRERALLVQHGKKWKSELPEIKGVTWVGFSRGFLSVAEFTDFAMLGTHAEKCRAVTPLEAVHTNWPSKRSAVKDLPAIPGLRRLKIQRRLVDERDVTRLANSQVLSTLHSLTIDDTALGLNGFRRLIASPHLDNLRALRTTRNSIGNGAIDLLVQANLPALEELDLSEEGSYDQDGEEPIIDVFGAEELANWSGLAKLRSLCLSGNNIQSEGLRVLFESPYTAGLKSLAVRNNVLDDEGLEHFANAPSGLRLDVLDLGENVLSDVGLRQFAQAECLSELKRLRLDHCELEAGAAMGLAQAPFIATLRHLNANDNSIRTNELSALLEAHPSELHTLELANNILDDAAGKCLAGTPAGDRLVQLDLDGNLLSEQSATEFSLTAHLRKLLVLRLNGNRFSQDAVTTLSKSTLGRRLSILQVEVYDENTNIPF